MTRPVILLKGSRGKFHIDLDLDLGSVNSAAFSFDIIFGIWALYLVYKSLRVLRRTQVSRIPCVIILFTSLFTLANDIVSSVEISIDGNEDHDTHLNLMFYLMGIWVYVQPDVLLAAALLIHIIYRTDVLNHPTSATRAALPRWKVYIDGVLIAGWTSFMIAILAVISLQLSSTYNYEPDTYPNLCYALHGFQIATTLNVAVFSVVLWVQMKKAKYWDKSINLIALIISPALVIRVVYLMVLDIVLGLPGRFDGPIFYDDTFEAINLASTLVEGLAVHTSILVFLRGIEFLFYEKAIKEVQSK